MTAPRESSLEERYLREELRIINRRKHYEEIGKTFKMKMMFEDRSFWTLNKMLELRAETHCDKPFLQYEEEGPLTFREVNEKVN